MADTYHEYDYLPEEKQRRRALKKRRRWPFVLLGFFIGFITLPALIALTVLLIVNRPVEKTVNTIDKVTNAGLYETLFGDDEKAGILNESYGDMSLSEAFKDIKSIAGKGSSLTFEDLAAISPKVEESIDKLIETAKEKSIILEKTEVMTTPLNQFSELLMDEVQEIEIGEVLLSVKSEIFDDPDTGAILKNLFFGKEGVNYETVDGKPVMLPVSYVYDGENDTFVCVDETSYTKNGDVWTTENSTNYIGRNGEVLALYSADGGVVYQLRADAASAPASKYTAVIVNAEGLIETVKQSSLTLGAFMGEDSNFMDVLGKLELGSLLGIRTKADVETSDAMLVALAVGTYGTDFTYDANDNIIPVGDKTFPTLGDLMNNPGDLLNNIQLGAMLGIKTKADVDTSDAMLVALAFGTEGTDFTYDANDNIIPVGDKTFPTLGDLMNNPGDLLNNIQLGSLLGITTKADAEANDPLLITIAYGTYGVDFEYDGDGDDSKIIAKAGGKPFTTVAMLMDSAQTEEIFKAIPLSSIFNVDIFDENADPLIISLVYGTEGTHYVIRTDGSGQKYIEWQIKDAGTGETYRERTFGDLRNGDMADIVKDLKLSSIFDVAEDETGLIATLVRKDWTINDLTEENIQSLTLREVLPGAIGTGEGDFFAALQDTPLKDLNAEYIKNNLTIGQALGITEENKDTYGMLYTFKDTYIGEFNESLLKSTLKIKDVVDINHPLLEALQDKTLEKIDENVINNLTLGTAIGVTSTEDPILGKVIDLTLGDLNNSGVLQNRINELQLGQLITLPETGVLGEMRNWTIGEINEEKVNGIKLSSLFTVADGDTGLLATLVHKTDSEGNPWTLAHLTTDNINTLTIGEVLGAEVESNFYLKHLQTSTLGSLSTDIQNLTVVQLFADSVYDESHNVKGTWKYLLTDPTGTIAPEEYKVTDMSALMNNMTANIQTATLRELKNDGLASNVSDTTLNAQLVCRILTVSYLDDLKTVLGDDTLTDADDNGYIDGMTMVDLTMLQLSDYLAWFLGKIGA